MSHERRGRLVAPKKPIAIVASRFNDYVVDALIRGAVGTLEQSGVSMDESEIIRVPGAFEIPMACQALAKTGRFSGIIALGVVIQGATKHFDYVCGPCASGIMQVQLATECPIAFGVLTTDTLEQAIERAGAKAGNKGEEAALALLESIDLLEQIHG